MCMRHTEHAEMQNAGRTLRCLCVCGGGIFIVTAVRWPQQDAGRESGREPGRRALATCLLPCSLIVQTPQRFIYWDLMDLFCHCLASPKCPHTLVRQLVLTLEPLHFCLQTNYVSRKPQASLGEGEKQAVLFCNNKSSAVLQKSSGHKWFPCFLHAKHTNPPAKVSPHHEIEFQLETRILPS